MFRVAKIKAAQQIGAYISGTRISSDLLIRSIKDKDSIKIEKVEIMIEQSKSFVKEIEFLTSFPKNNTNEEIVFIYSKEIKVRKQGK